MITSLTQKVTAGFLVYIIYIIVLNDHRAFRNSARYVPYIATANNLSFVDFPYTGYPIIARDTLVLVKSHRVSAYNNWHPGSSSEIVDARQSGNVGF